MNATLRISSSDVRKELSIQDDRTESDNRVEVTLLKGIAENNLPHTVRCKSTKPPYAERHVRWCGRSVNVKVGGKCLLWITFTSYPILWTSRRPKQRSKRKSQKVFTLTTLLQVCKWTEFEDWINPIAPPLAVSILRASCLYPLKRFLRISEDIRFRVPCA